MSIENHSQTASFIWAVADLLRGDFKQSQYGRVILPFTLLRRLECVLEPTRSQVLAAAESNANKPDSVREKLLLREADQQFFNASPLTLVTLSDTQTADDLMSYVQSFSQAAREIFEHFHFEDFVQQLASNNLLYQVVQRFAGIDLSPNSISNFGMGIIFEELIRRFAESSNETAGEHFTPRDIVHLTASLVLTGQEGKLQPNSIVTIYDPTAGTGGFLSEGDEYIQQVSTGVTVSLLGQELNPESYAICKADMLIKGQAVENIKLGNTLSNDQLATLKADFMLANPPFGVEWKKVQKEVNDEHKLRGHEGRFGPGLPRVSDGSLLFLLHLVSKMRAAKDGGSRIGIILNGSPLFTGGAGSGESEIRRHLLQNDLVEAIIALPTDMFYNTGIATYIWVLSNRKPEARRSNVQLINAAGRFSKMRKSLGSKRQYIDDENIAAVVRAYGALEETAESKIFPAEAFGYRRITVERPLRLSAQISLERVEELRFAPGTLNAPMKLIFHRYGQKWQEADYGDLTSIETEVRALLKGDFPDLKDKLLRSLFDREVWVSQKELLDTGLKLLDAIGTAQHDDFNTFQDLLKRALKNMGLKLGAKEFKQLLDAITWTNADAEPVIHKVLKTGAEPMYGAFEYRGQVVAFQPDSNLRDNEDVPLTADTARGVHVNTVNETYFAREVAPHVGDAWIDNSKCDEQDGQVGIVGYEIPFNRHFYVYTPPRDLDEIDAELEVLSIEIMDLLRDLHS